MLLCVQMEFIVVLVDILSHPCIWKKIATGFHDWLTIKCKWIPPVSAPSAQFKGAVECRCVKPQTIAWTYVCCFSKPAVTWNWYVVLLESQFGPCTAVLYPLLRINCFCASQANIATNASTIFSHNLSLYVRHSAESSPPNPLWTCHPS